MASGWEPMPECNDLGSIMFLQAGSLGVSPLRTSARRYKVRCMLMLQRTGSTSGNGSMPNAHASSSQTPLLGGRGAVLLLRETGRLFPFINESPAFPSRLGTCIQPAAEPWRKKEIPPSIS